MHVEPVGANSKFPDYLFIENSGEKFYGDVMPRLLIKSENLVSLQFKSDWITTASVKDPKGFLLYFKSNILTFKWKIEN